MASYNQTRERSAAHANSSLHRLHLWDAALPCLYREWLSHRFRRPKEVTTQHHDHHDEASAELKACRMQPLGCFSFSDPSMLLAVGADLPCPGQTNESAPSLIGVLTQRSERCLLLLPATSYACSVPARAPGTTSPTRRRPAPRGTSPTARPFERHPSRVQEKQQRPETAPCCNVSWHARTVHTESSQTSVTSFVTVVFCICPMPSL